MLQTKMPGSTCFSAPLTDQSSPPPTATLSVYGDTVKVRKSLTFSVAIVDPTTLLYKSSKYFCHI